jgi:hypothetical protein
VSAPAPRRRPPVRSDRPAATGLASLHPAGARRCRCFLDRAGAGWRPLRSAEGRRAEHPPRAGRGLRVDAEQAEQGAGADRHPAGLRRPVSREIASARRGARVGGRPR